MGTSFSQTEADSGEGSDADPGWDLGVRLACGLQPPCGGGRYKRSAQSPPAAVSTDGTLTNA